MMKLCFQQFAFLLRKIGWKALLLLVFLWVFYSSGNFMMQWNGEYVDIVASDNIVFRYWLISIYVIGAVSILLLYSIYRYKTRWMLIQGNRLSYILADILFVMLVFILWYAMFMWLYFYHSVRTLAWNGYENRVIISQGIQMFYSYIPEFPLARQLFPYSLQNILSCLFLLLFYSSCIEFLFLGIIKEKHKLWEGIYLVIMFGLSWYVLKNYGFFIQIVIYILLFVANFVINKFNWKKKQMGG